MTTDPLVSTDWLAERLNDPQLVVLDASWFLPGVDRNGREEYGRAHIPGARFFDIDAVSDHADPLPHMLPTADAFAEATSALGIGDETCVVVYAADGMVPASRVWWMFRVFGHDSVKVLDGGLPKWLAEGRPVETGTPAIAPRPFTARPNPALVRNFEQVRDELRAGRQVADARSAPRFRGEMPEPRAGLRAGHIPGSKSLPATAFLATDGTFKAGDELAAAFAAHHLHLAEPLTASCGSGISACMIVLGRARLGDWNTPVYDGSWTEWGARADAPVATGA